MHDEAYTSETESQGQRQDSLIAQMQTVMKLAVSAGCYDAHDWLIRNFGCESCNGCEVDMCHACGRGMVTQERSS